MVRKHAFKGFERIKKDKKNIIIINRIIPNVWTELPVVPKIQANQSQISQRNTLLRGSHFECKWLAQ